MNRGRKVGLAVWEASHDAEISISFRNDGAEARNSGKQCWRDFPRGKIAEFQDSQSSHDARTADVADIAEVAKLLGRRDTHPHTRLGCLQRARREGDVKNL